MIKHLTDSAFVVDRSLEPRQQNYNGGYWARANTFNGGFLGSPRSTFRGWGTLGGGQRAPLKPGFFDPFADGPQPVQRPLPTPMKPYRLPARLPSPAIQDPLRGMKQLPVVPVNMPKSWVEPLLFGTARYASRGSPYAQVLLTLLQMLYDSKAIPGAPVPGTPFVPENCPGYAIFTYCADTEGMSWFGYNLCFAQAGGYPPDVLPAAYTEPFLWGWRHYTGPDPSVVAEVTSIWGKVGSGTGGPFSPAVPAGDPRIDTGSIPFSPYVLPPNPWLPDTQLPGLPPQADPFPPPVPYRAIPMLRGLPGKGPIAPAGSRPPPPPSGWRPQLPDLSGGPPHHVEPPSPGTKERKRLVPLGLFGKIVKHLVNPITEANDLLDALYEALPWSLRKKIRARTPQAKAWAIYANWGQMSLRDALHNIATNELGDRVFGYAGQKLTKAVRGNPYWNSPVGLQAGGRFRPNPGVAGVKPDNWGIW